MQMMEYNNQRLTFLTITVILYFLLERRFIMKESSEMVDTYEPLRRSHLIKLYKHYWSILLAELGFCHQYLNFYSGLLSAILAATLAGLLSIKFGDLRGLALLLGPFLILVLAYNGYQTVETFYRRFVQAWVTTLNIESMLHIRYSPQPITLGYKPAYLSNQNSFIPTIEDDRIKGILEAKEQKKGAEQVTKELSESKKGTTLRNAKITFIAFGMAAAILAVLIVLVTVIPSLVQK